MTKKRINEALEKKVKKLEKKIIEVEASQKKIERITLVLRTIRNVNQLNVREKDRNRLIQGIVDSLIENRGYFNAWIALFDASGRFISYAGAGLGKAFLPMLEKLKRGELTDCGQKASKNSGVILIKEPIFDCIDCPLSQHYAGRSAMTVRLEHGSNVYGLLCVSIPEKLVSDEEEQELFAEIAGDIAFAMHNIVLERERKEAEEALRKSEKRFRDLVKNAPVGISIIQDDKIIYQNPEQEKFLGPIPRKIIFTDHESIHPDDVDKVKAFYKRMTSGKVISQDIEFRFFLPSKIKPKRDMKWVYGRANRIEYRGIEAILVILMDISRTKELEHLVRIQDKMSSLGRVAAGIAHEIRNPLSGINIYLNTLKKIYDKQQDLDKVEKIIGQIQSASIKIESVVKRVMDFSKPSEPKFVLTDINQHIEGAISLSSVTLRKRGITLEKILSQNLPACHVDPNMIEQVILNLITNAAEAMQTLDGEKIIEVASSKEDPYVLVRVSDSGPGVPLNFKKNIFDPFYSTKNGSTGIGLSLCQRIIMDHEGSLDVFTSRWGGAEFLIKIPIKKRSMNQ